MIVSRNGPSTSLVELISPRADAYCNLAFRCLSFVAVRRRRDILMSAPDHVIIKPCWKYETVSKFISIVKNITSMVIVGVIEPPFMLKPNRQPRRYFDSGCWMHASVAEGNFKKRRHEDILWTANKM
jgi:hypothetical protein